ncbi:MAG: carbohydrate porin [Cyanobacteria bacterium P01_D01_bin.50]
MIQEVLNCDKYINSKPISKVYPLLCSISFLTLWIVAFSSSAIAQTNSSSTNARVAAAPLTNRLESQVQPPKIEKIEDLENSFIEEMATPEVSSGKKSPSGRTSELKNQSRAFVNNLPAVAAQDISQVGLQLPRQAQKGARQQTNLISQGSEPTFNQLLNPQQQPARKFQEFVTPGITNSQAGVAPLPPLPGTQVQPAQSNGVDSQPTFNQLLNSPKSQASAEVNSRLSNNPLLTSPTSQPTVTTNSQPVLNQTANSGAPKLPLPAAQRTSVQPRVQPSVVSSPSLIAQPVKQTQVPPFATTVKRKPLKEPSLKLEGVYVKQGEDSSARARVTGIYPLTPQSLLGATVDLTSEDNSFDDSRGEGLNINELYYATSLGGLPNLRLVAGQMDLTSYFDRNSFAKDGASHFFNPVFQTNPALSSTGIGSRPGLLLNWSVTDNVAAKAAVFSSSDELSDLSLDGFAGEIGIRHGNAIVRGTYSTARDAGNRDSFVESFGIKRKDSQFGPLEDDREEAYGINAEVFIPSMKLGLFGRYGRYENRDLGKGADTYSFGLSFLDLFAPDDRLGLAYGRALSNDDLREGEQPDVVELFYDVKFLPNLRFGLSYQGRDNFEESVLGVRIKSEFDITPRRKILDE